IHAVLRFVDPPARENVGGISAHRENRRVERVDRVETELQRLPLRDRESLRQAHVDLLYPGPSLAGDRTGAQLPGTWDGHGRRIEPHISAACKILVRRRDRRSQAVWTRLEVRAGWIVAELDH